MNATQVEISRSAYHRNIAFLRRMVGDKELALVIKANGYGHGLKEMTTLAVEAGISVLCVHSIAEAEQVRAHFSGRIVIIGPTHSSQIERVVLCNAETVCYSVNSLNLLNKSAREAGTTVPIHLKLETGTNRQGIADEALDRFLAQLKKSSHIKLKAVYSHFANIEDTTDPTFAWQQLAEFERLTAQVESYGFANFERHFASSAATIIYPETHFDMVRVGLAQYGLWPSRETYLSFVTKHGGGEYLRPILSWKTWIAQVKSVPQGEHIGYGCSATVTRTSNIAVLPVGYSDGYFRILSNKSRVLIDGRFAPIVGRIAMNLMMVDVTDIPGVKEGDEVVLIGKSGEQNISVEELAAHALTINYEVVTAISSHISRVLVD